MQQWLSKQPSLLTQSILFARAVITGKHALSKFVPILLLLADAVLCMLVIWRIPYTEIDWTAYMEQVSQYVAGERNYANIKGGTGPLVYPAAHLQIYTGLFNITDHGTDILLAQKLFAGLYLVTLGVVMACYWKAKAPPYVFPLLILSKRLHSIFMLRCFNDCFAVFFLFTAILLFQHRFWAVGTMVYAYGLGVKMSLLLVLPAIGIILLFASGPVGGLITGLMIPIIQFWMAIPFMDYPAEYLGRAFEFSRQFLFKWTVNWRFVGEEAFLNKGFSTTLLVLHVSVLTAFIITRWLPAGGKSVQDVIMSFFDPKQRSQPICPTLSPSFILTTILTANLIGLLFARSLHYQFYAYLAWTTPFLLWKSGLHPTVMYVLWLVQEVVWNIYPSTTVSSLVVVGVMALTLVAVWVGVRPLLESHLDSAVEARLRAPSQSATAAGPSPKIA